MPYVICGDCNVLTYSAALWAGTDECPRCGAQLPTARHDDQDPTTKEQPEPGAARGLRLIRGGAEGEERRAPARDEAAD